MANKKTTPVVKQPYPTLKEMIMMGWDFGKKDFESCSPMLKRIINMGLYSTCLFCLGAVWSAYYYRCSCEIAWYNLGRVQTSMVLYQNGRAFISQSKNMDLKAGLQNIVLNTVPQQLILPSVMVSGPNIRMQSMNFNPANEKHTYFERTQTQAIGQPVTLMWEVWKDGKKTELTKDAQLLASEGREPVLLIDGRVQKGTDAKILYPTPKKDAKTQPDLSFTVLSDMSGEQTVNFSYMASGFEWKAFYNLYLDEEHHTMDVLGQVNLTNNSGVAYHNVNLDFVLGDINTLHYVTPVQPENICEIKNEDGIHVASETAIVNGNKYQGAAVPKAAMYANGMMAAREYGDFVVADRDAKVMRRKGGLDSKTEVRDLKDYYVYHVPIPVQLNKSAPTMATFLNGQGLSYHKEYVLNNIVSLGSGGEIKNIAPILNLTFNTKNLGLPLPRGDFRVFNKQKNGVFFVGESRVDKITMPNQDVRVRMGEALDVYADTSLVDYKTISDEEVLYTYEINVRNVSNETKDVTVSQSLIAGEYILKDVYPTASRATPSQVKWQFELPANANQIIRFTVLWRNLALIERKNEMRFKEDLCKDRAIIVRTKSPRNEEYFEQ